MNAAEAKTRYLSARTSVAEKRLERILNDIRITADFGDCKLPPGALWPETVEALESLGYKVSSLETIGGTFQTVSWE